MVTYMFLPYADKPLPEPDTGEARRLFTWPGGCASGDPRGARNPLAPPERVAGWAA